MEDVEKLEMLAGRRWCAQQGIENGAFHVRLCVGPRPPGSDKRVAQPTTTGVRVSYLILFTTRNAQGILQNTYS